MSKLEDELGKIIANRDFNDASKEFGEAARNLRHSQVDMFKELRSHAGAISHICDFLIKAFEERELK